MALNNIDVQKMMNDTVCRIDNKKETQVISDNPFDYLQ